MALRAKRKSARPQEYIGGIRNTDLDEAYWQTLTPEQRASVRDSGLWDVKTDAEMHPPKSDTEGGEH